MRWGCRRWIASQRFSRSLRCLRGCRSPPCSDLAVDGLQGPCLCLHPLRPEPVWWFVPFSLTKGRGLSEPPEPCHQTCHHRLMSPIKHSGPALLPLAEGCSQPVLSRVGSGRAQHGAAKPPELLQGTKSLPCCSAGLGLKTLLRYGWLEEAPGGQESTARGRRISSRVARASSNHPRLRHEAHLVCARRCVCAWPRLPPCDRQHQHWATA